MVAEMPPTSPPPSLFANLLGAAFDRLPAGIRRIHAGSLPVRFSGACDIKRGSTVLGRLAGTLAGMPAAGSQVPLTIEIGAAVDGETWTRHFGTRQVRSRMTAEGGLLVERLGLLTIAFRLDANAHRIVWSPQGGRILGVALPEAFFRGVIASESLVAGRYHFDVRAALPVIGLVIHYRGWLE